MYYLCILLLVSTVSSFTGLQLVTDNWPREISWKLETYPGLLLVDGRDTNYYGNPNTEVNEAFPALQPGEYYFTIMDSAGDGICCEYGNGSYNIIVNDEVVYVGDGRFGMSHSNVFTVGSPGSFTGVHLKTDKFPWETSWKLKTYPGLIYVDARDEGFYSAPNTEDNDAFPTLQPGEYNFEIIDSAGDGICCGYGNGSYNILVNGQVVYAGDGNFGVRASNNFRVGSSSDNATDAKSSSNKVKKKR